MDVDGSQVTEAMPGAMDEEGPREPERTPGTALVPVPESVSGPTVLDLATRSTRLGIDAGRLMVGELAGRSLRVGRWILPPVLAERPLDAVEEQLVRRRDAARVSEQRALEGTKDAARTVLNQVVVGVVDMLDMGALIDHVPVDDVVARVDVAAVVEEIDLGGIVRQSTTSLGGETVDAVRVEVMALDLFGARLVDKLFRRKAPRDLSFEGYDVTGPEIRVPKELR